MQNMNIVVDVQGNIFITCVDEKIFILEVTQPNPKVSPRVRVGVNFKENYKHSESKTKCKR